MLEENRKKVLAFLQGLGGEGDPSHFFQGDRLGEEQRLDGSQGDRDQPGEMGSARGAKNPSLPGAEKKLFP